MMGIKGTAASVPYTKIRELYREDWYRTKLNMHLKYFCTEILTVMISFLVMSIILTRISFSRVS